MLLLWVLFYRITYNTPSLHPQGVPGGKCVTKQLLPLCLQFVTPDPYCLLVCIGNMLMEEHHALGNFNAENKTELSIETGDLVMVLAKDPSGSGYVRLSDTVAL